MKFNFEAWALCRIEVEDDPDEDSRATLIDIWPTKLDAENGRDAIEDASLRRHNKREKDFAEKFWANAPLHYVAGVYVTVPLSQMRFGSLSEAEDMIEQAAALMYKGCGVQA